MTTSASQTHDRPKVRNLTAERLREVIIYDPETGIFTWRISRPGCVAGRVAGTVLPGGWRQIEIDYTLHRAARLAWLYVTGEWPRPGLLVDHENRRRGDDRWSNLREATCAQNSRNRGSCRRNTSGHVGVHPVRGGARWGAEIGVDGRSIYLGCFADKADAIAARVAAEKLHFGEFRRLEAPRRGAIERSRRPFNAAHCVGQAAH